MSLKLGNQTISGLSINTVKNARHLLEPFWSDHILNDMSCLRADTFSWQSGTTYTAAYGHLTSDIVGKTLVSETINNITIQYYLANDGHKICPATQETNVLALYNSIGIGWYYILDLENARFKLPRTKFGFTGLRDTAGNVVDAGLPNITGSHAGVYNGDGLSGAFANSAFAQDHTYLATNWVDSTINISAQFNFDASYSNPIYGNSDTVQPPATQMFLYFYVGEFATSAIEQTAGITSEVLNTKVNKTGDVMSGALNISGTAINNFYLCQNSTYDITSSTAPSSNKYSGQLSCKDANSLHSGDFFVTHDTDNNMLTGITVHRKVDGSDYYGTIGAKIDATGKDFITCTAGVRDSLTQLPFPSSNRDTLTLLATGSQYTAPANGYFFAIFTNAGNSNCYAQIVNLTSRYGQQNQINSNYGTLFLAVPALKGEKVALNYSNITGDIYFLYAVGT